jgi:hypothetical protein
MSEQQNSPVISPCIGVCKMDYERDVCLGCWRSLDEIALWGLASVDEQRAILREVAKRRAARKAERSGK